MTAQVEGLRARRISVSPPRELMEALRGAKRAAAPLVHEAAYRSGLSARLAAKQRVRRIVMYHGVGAALPAAAFREQLLHLRRHYQILSLDKLVELHCAGRPPRGEVALTFDDGLRNNLTEAYPVLRELSIPATFFVCPGLIEHRCWIFSHEALARLDWMTTAARGALAASWGLGREDDVKAIRDWIKTLDTGRRKEAMARLRGASAGYTPTAADRREFELMTWDELESLDPALITVGAHTVSHPVLVGSTPAEVEAELRESRAWLERRLERPVEHFCYPNAGCDDGIIEVARRYFRTAVTDVGHVSLGADLHRLPRIPAAPSAAYLAWRMHRPEA
jgi:peptidoglycan/xylan/chitin deacetylase (PgdA/CDA1 family)